MVAPIGGGFGSMMNKMQGPTGAAGAAGEAGAAGAAGAAGSPEELQKALEELQKMLQMMMEILKNMGFAPPEAQAAPVAQAPKGGGAPAAQAASSGGGGGADGFAPAAGGGGAGGAGGAGGMAAAGQSTPTGPAVNVQGIMVDPALAPAVQQIANHPDGAKLLAAAKANGLTEITVNSNLNPDGGAGTEGLFIPGQNKIEIANPNGENLIHLLGHELGHAATKQDGNSFLEEQTVDALGAKIHRDITGAPSTFNLDEASYNDLQRTNGVLNSLRSIGIRV
jgi:hypothetical protein